MSKDVIMPKFGFTQESAEIVRWLREAGEHVEQGDPIVEVTTDKVNMEVEAPTTGILDGLRFAAGDVVPVTEVIAVIRAADEAPLAAGSPTAAAEAASVPAQTEVASAPEVPTRPNPSTPVARELAKAAGVDLVEVAGSGPGGRIMRRDVEAHAGGNLPGNDKLRAVPAARRRGRELNLDLNAITGSGPGGRVQSADVLAAQQRQAAQPAQTQGAPQAAPQATQPQTAQPAPQAASSTAEALPSGVLRVVPLAGMRRTIANRLQRSAQDAPHIYLEADIDVTEAEALRARANAMLGQAQARVSLTAIIARACAWALKRHPLVNSQLDGERILLMEAVHIGVAVALDEGLIVPVLRDVGGKGLFELASALGELAERARKSQLRPEDVQGSTFTISNLGMYGVDRFTAIINPPTSAILAVGRTRRMFVPDEHDQPVLRPIMTVTLSADHRVIDGAVAGRFLSDLRQGLEQPDRLLF